MQREILVNDEALNILNSITWYNGIYEPLLEVKERIKKAININMSRPDDKEHFKDDQFEIFWMMLVLQFGDYGTSPRYGWLEMKNKDKIIEFIDKITVTGSEENIFDEEVK